MDIPERLVWFARAGGMRALLAGGGEWLPDTVDGPLFQLRDRRGRVVAVVPAAEAAVPVVEGRERDDLERFRGEYRASGKVVVASVWLVLPPAIALPVRHRRAGARTLTSDDTLSIVAELPWDEAYEASAAWRSWWRRVPWGAR